MINGRVQDNDSIGIDSNSNDCASYYSEKNMEKKVGNENAHTEYPVLNFNPPPRPEHKFGEIANPVRGNDDEFGERHHTTQSKTDIPKPTTATLEQISKENENGFDFTNIEHSRVIFHEDDAASNSLTVVPEETSTEGAKTLEFTDSVDLTRPSGLASTSGLTTASDFTHTSDFDFNFPSDHKETRLHNGSDPNEPSMPTKKQDVLQLGPLALALLMTGICLAVFLISLDRTIVATVRNWVSDSLSRERANVCYLPRLFPE